MNVYDHDIIVLLVVHGVWKLSRPDHNGNIHRHCRDAEEALLDINIKHSGHFTLRLVMGGEQCQN